MRLLLRRESLLLRRESLLQIHESLLQIYESLLQMHESLLQMHPLPAEFKNHATSDHRSGIHSVALDWRQ